MKSKYASYTHIGGRINNEDFLCITKNSNGLLLIIADGLGGHDKGEIASSIAATTLKKLFKDTSKPFDIVAAINTAHLAILEKQAATGLNLRTTIAVAWIADSKTTFAHVGDTRIYAFNDDDIVYQSVDHSVAQMAVAVGEIETPQIREHEDRNVLTRTLGNTKNIKPDIRTIDNDDYDSILLCSDGFWEYVYENEMIVHKITNRKPKVWLKQMRKTLKKRAPKNIDNNTAITYIKGGR